MPHIPPKPIPALKSRLARDRRRMIKQITGIDLQVYSLLSRATGGGLGRGLSDAVFECMAALEGTPNGTEAIARVSLTFTRDVGNVLSITLETEIELPDKADSTDKPDLPIKL
ncbi:hypothetical protein FACS1894184_11610 [Clostridia bacterium]|nr:hypothetical protein FACS1894184_11610 [Clostridia bacterium]